MYNYPQCSKMNYSLFVRKCILDPSEIAEDRCDLDWPLSFDPTENSSRRIRGISF